LSTTRGTPEIGDIDEGRRDPRPFRQEVVHQRVGATIDGVRGDDVIAGFAQREQRRGNGAHPARRAVGGFRSLDGRKLQAEVIHGGIEMPPVEITAGIVALEPLEHGRHRAGLHHGERRACLDGHVDAAVLAELVAQARQRFDGIATRHPILPLRKRRSSALSF
jgi:hypothetical protein